MQYVSPLDEARPLTEVGGKAFHLQRMLAAQLPVPAGIVVTDGAFQNFLAHNGLQSRIELLIAQIKTAEAESLRAASEAIRTLVANAEIPAPVREEVVAGLRSLPSFGIVAVRSSAVGEDSARDSFAGQLDSILHVEPQLDAILAAVKACWASYWSERVLGYQQQRGVKLQGMGVIVQAQVAAAYSGVLFTRHPAASLDSAQGAMLLEYCTGLGDQLVSGSISPVSVALDRNGDAQLPTPPANPDAAALNAEQLMLLAEYGRELERLFGGPQDIEWSVTADDKICLLQSRPITTLERPANASARNDDPLVVWSNANVNENYPDPITPLLYSVASLGYYHYFRNLGLALGVARRRVEAMEEPLRHLVGTQGARLYYNLTNIYAVLRMAPFGDWLSEAFANFVGAELVANDDPDKSRTWRGFSRGRIWQVWEVGVIAVRSAWQFLFLRRRVARFERTVTQFAAETCPERLAQHSPDELLADLRGFVNIRCHRWLDASLADAAAMLSYGLLKGLLNREFPEAGEAALHNSLLKGLRDVVSGAPAARLWELSRQIRADDRLHALFREQDSAYTWHELQTTSAWSSFHEQLQAYLNDWGFRCSGELMLTVPSFQERPEALVEILQAYAELVGESPAARLERQAEERKTESQRILSELSRRWLVKYLPWPRKSLLARWLLAWTQQAIICRERARLKQALLYGRLRRIALAIGELLVKRGFLDSRDGVFFLTIQELDSLLAGGLMYAGQTRELVEMRQMAHREATRVIPPGTISLPSGAYWEPGSDGAANHTSPAHTGKTLRGTGVCGGKVTAPAAVLNDVTELSRLAQGSILVTRQTDPGWGPVFPLIHGLVIERGGMLSHGAILAREYGLPTVVGIEGATELIRAGQFITVDGDHGRVELS